MPILENAKHEEFCKQISKGIKQAEAYRRAGYTPNAAAASRLASEPHIQDRVAELRTEVVERVQTAMVTATDADWKRLEDLGINYLWVASQLKLVYEVALDAEHFNAALTSLQQITKLIEAEKKGDLTEKVEEESSKISVTEVTNLLKTMKEVMSVEKPMQIDVTDMKDITPKV